METEVAEIKRIESGKYLIPCSAKLSVFVSRVPQGCYEQAEDGREEERE